MQLHAQIQLPLGPGLDAFAQGLFICGGRGSNSLSHVSPSASPWHADPVEHIALDEIAGAVRHRIASKSSSVRRLVQAGDADALIQRAQALARSKPKAIRTPSALYFSDLF